MEIIDPTYIIDTVKKRVLVGEDPRCRHSGRSRLHFPETIVKSDVEGAAAQPADNHLVVHAAVITPKDTIGQRCLQVVRHLTAALLHYIGNSQYRLGVGEIIVGIGCGSTLDELVISAAEQLDILTTVADQAIVCRYAAVYPQYAGVIAVVDDTLIQQHLRCVARGPGLDYDGLVRIPYHGILQ